jgi:hypothetical protein
MSTHRSTVITFDSIPFEKMALKFVTRTRRSFISFEVMLRSACSFIVDGSLSYV